LAVTEPSVATEVHESLDVHGHLAPQVTFDLETHRLDHFADAAAFVVVQLVAAFVERNAGGFSNLARVSLSPRLKISESDLHSLGARKIDARYACHEITSIAQARELVLVAIARAPFISLVISLVVVCAENFHK